PRISSKIVAKAKSPISSTIKSTPPSKKFSHPRLKYFCDNSGPDYHIMRYRNAMTLYNNDAWIYKMFPSTLEDPSMRWFSESLAHFIDCFESLADIFTHPYSMYRDGFLKAIRAELAKVEKPDYRLATITFNQGLYFHSTLSQKLNKITITPLWRSVLMWRTTSLAGKTKPEKRSLIKATIDDSIKKWENRDTPSPYPRRNDRKGCKGRSAQPKPRQYTALNTIINNILLSIKDKPFLKWPKPFPEHLNKKSKARKEKSAMSLIMMRMIGVQQRSPPLASIASMEDRGCSRKEKLANLSKKGELRLL
ncbi:hypothetical protein DVH24_039349, partial [Malus domestica]